MTTEAHELLDELPDADREHLRKIATPLAYQRATWKGPWMAAPHLEHINQRIVDAVFDPAERFLVIEASVRHGKSQLCSKALPEWHLGLFPDRNVGIITYNETFARRWGAATRDNFREHGPSLFGVGVSETQFSAGLWETTEGGMCKAVGAGQSITGEGLHLPVIDDPIKDREQAESQLERDKLWDWFWSVPFTRLEPGGTMVILMARWHHDDIIGRLRAQAEEIRALEGVEFEFIRFPAICELPKGEDPETWRDEIGRRPGEALWPERFPLERLQRIQATPGAAQAFQSLYQQNPTTPGGDRFKTSEWKYLDADEVPPNTRWVRYWDLAATEGGGDWTVGVKFGRTPDGRFVVAHVRRGQWKDEDVDANMKATAASDGYAVPIRFEQEPGSSGKRVAEAMVRMLAGYDASYERPDSSKEVRARNYAVQQKVGNVYLVRGGDWIEDFIDEHEKFPRGAHDDQVDAAAGAFNYFAEVGRVSLTIPGENPDLADIDSLIMSGQRAAVGPLGMRGPMWR